VSNITPDWTSFTLDLDLAGLGTDVSHIDMINLNFFIGGYAPGELQIDNLVVQTTVPEPTSASLLGLGLAGLLASRLRRRS
ncbi:MAG: PEP-CTERM sorting domain-containing protein, partial [Verrucomicrobia bacterium]|nr:PEP-CTERM sorting domain-containing protein [Verrucomicrobiota bacterium]